MPEVTLERVAEEVKSLTADEQRQLRGMLDDWLSKPPAEDSTGGDMEAKEQLLLQRLLEKGIISKIPSGPAVAPAVQADTSPWAACV